MGAMASQITSLAIVYSTIYSGADQRKHQSSASLAFVRGIHRWPVNSPHTWPVTRKMFPFDAVIIHYRNQQFNWTFRNRLKWNLNQSWNIFFSVSMFHMITPNIDVPRLITKPDCILKLIKRLHFSLCLLQTRHTEASPRVTWLQWRYMSVIESQAHNKLTQLRTTFFNVIVMSRNSIYIIVFKKSWQCLRYGQHIFEKKMHIHLS